MNGVKEGGGQEGRRSSQRGKEEKKAVESFSKEERERERERRNKVHKQGKRELKQDSFETTT